MTSTRTDRGTAKVVYATGSVLTLGTALVVATPGVASAATFEVTNLDDDGAGSLRAAIDAANDAAGADVITFTGAGASGTITLTSGEIAITDDVDIQGPGAAALAISGNESSRIFYIDAPETVTISGLTFKEGNDGGGGAIRSDDDEGPQSLTLSDTVFEDNESGSYGGAVYFSGSDFEVRDSTFRRNIAGSSGGALELYEAETLVVTDSTFTENSTGDRGGAMYISQVGSATITGSTFTLNTAAYFGGALAFLYSSGLIERTTISDNTAKDDGGGIYFYGGSDRSLTIVNTTISGNASTEGDGGGIAMYYDGTGAMLSVRHSTITDNTAVNGGGIWLDFLDPTESSIDHTILAGNTASGAGNDLGSDDSDPQTVTLSNSILGDSTTPDVTIADDGNNQLDVDPLLEALADNGGPTHTHALADGSPALDTGDPDFASPPDTDQRGEARVGFGTIDIGAYERNSETPEPTAATTPATTPPTTPPVTAAAAPTDLGTLPVTGGDTPWAPLAGIAMLGAAATWFRRRLGADPGRT